MLDSAICQQVDAAAERRCILGKTLLLTCSVSHSLSRTCSPNSLMDYTIWEALQEV